MRSMSLSTYAEYTTFKVVYEKLNRSRTWWEIKKVQANDNMIEPYNMLTRPSETQTRPESNEK